MYDPAEHDLLGNLLDVLPEHHPGFTEKKHRDFITRLSSNFSIITHFHTRLYGHREDHRHYFEELIFLLFDYYNQRLGELKQLDQEREHRPNWLMSQQWTGMMLYLDKFSKDLKGFNERIDYLQELGVNWVHIMPLLKSPKDESDGGYAVSDYRRVDKKYGSMADIRSIAKKFRDRNMLLTLDLVLNHTSRKHPWAKKALKGDKKYQDYYYMFGDRLVPDQFEAHLPEVFPVSAPGNFTFQEEIQKWVMTVFHEYQWDLNYQNPQMFNEMMAVLLNLANQGVDILRLDAPAFLWKKIGTNSQNLPEAHMILKLMKRCTEIVAPGVKFIAEAIVAPQEIIKYFGRDDEDHECDIAYHATLMALIWESLATGETRLLNKVIEKLPKKPPGTTWINYVRCHDDIGLGFEDRDIYELGLDAKLHRSFLIDYYTGKFPGSPSIGAPFMFNPKNGDARISGTLASLTGLEKAMGNSDQKEIDLAINRILLLHSIILCFGGLPMINSGDEIGLVNDYSYLNDPVKAYDNRWMHRPAMDWDWAARRSEKGTIPNRVFQQIRRLIEIRKNTPELADFNTTQLCFCENKHILAFLRWDDTGRKTLFLGNFHATNQFINKEILYRYGFDMNRGVIDKYTEESPMYHRELIEFNAYQFYILTDKSYFTPIPPTRTA